MISGDAEVSGHSGISADANISGATDAPDLVEAEAIIRRYLAQWMEHGDDLDDVAQLSLIKAWRKWSTFRGRSRRTSWLYRLTRNEFVSWTRKREYWEKGDGAAIRPPRADEGLGESVIGRITVGRLLGRLPRRHREVIELSVLHGHTSAEVGRHFGAAPSTVRCWKRDARREIRELVS